MTTTLMPAPRQRFYDNNGRPLANGLLYTYAAGTSTPKDAYTDAAGLVPHDNPIRLDAHGEATVYWSGNYKLDLKNEHGVQITGYPVDNFNTDPAGLWGAVSAFMATLASSIGASLVGFLQAGVGAVLRTVQDKERDTVNVFDFMSAAEIADAKTGTPTLDHTAGIQRAIDYAQSLVIASADGVGDQVGGCDVLLRGVFRVTGPLRISKSNVSVIGQGGTTIYADYTSSAGYNGAKPVFIVGTAEAWQNAGTIFTNAKYNRLSGIHVKTHPGRLPFIGVLFSGTRNAHISDCLFENGYCGVYMENTSELLSEQVSVIGCTYGVIADNRGNRIASSSVLNVACVDNDVSSNTFVMTTLYYPQHTGFLAINAGTTTISGMTIGNFSENPVPFPGLGLPPDHAGIHVLGANVKWTRAMDVNGAVLEPSQALQIDCIRIESATQNNPVSGVSINGVHVQTFAADYAGGKYTVLLRMLQSGLGTINNVVLRDSGFTPQNVGYYTGTMCVNSGTGEVSFDGCYPGAAFATSSLGIYGWFRGVEYLERVPLTAFVPPGWASDGVTAGCSLQGGSLGNPAYLHFTGNTGVIDIYKDFIYREFTQEIRQVFITALYRADCVGVFKARVNGDVTTDSDIASPANIPRYSNALIGPVLPGSSTEWRRIVLCFNPFDAGYSFDRVLFILGKAVSATNANFVDLRDIRIGYMTGAPAKYNPFS
jgi:hypothetical protein